MTAAGWIQIVVYFVALLALTKPLGAYMYRAFESKDRPFPSVLGRLERLCLRLCGVDADHEQTWKGYFGSLMVFSFLGIAITWAIQMFQESLPLNPQHLAAPSWHLALNTAVSFTTNTNWQAYGGESTLSYFSQMIGLAWHNFVSAAAGIGVALAMARGLTRQPGPGGSKTLGSFWTDLIRGTVYVLLPLSLAMAVALVACGVIQNFSAYVDATTLEGAKQSLAMGPAASQIAIKQLGTNGGGFFNVNSAHPFENATAICNFLECLAILLIPAALTFTYGKMAKDTRQGWALFAAMSFLFLSMLAVCYWAEAKPNAAIAGLGVDQSAGNLEGKEVRFGVANSALWATATTDASNGSVNCMHDSMNPVGGLVPLVNIEFGEVVFGGVGAGLYGMLVFVILAVFIAGLMVGRTPEYLGKKIESHEMKVVAAYMLVFAFFVLVPAAWASVSEAGLAGRNNQGPHGLSEMLYACSSGTGNNGSAFAGLTANTPYWDLLLAACMFFGRFAMIAPCLAIAGSMIGKKTVKPGLGTFPTHGALFTSLLVAVIVIVGALTFMPALCLGPIVEHFQAAAGKTY